MSVMQSFNTQTNNSSICSQAWTSKKNHQTRKIHGENKSLEEQNSLNNAVTPTKISKSEEGNIALVTQSAVKSNKSEGKLNEEKFKRIISNQLSDLF